MRSLAGGRGPHHLQGLRWRFAVGVVLCAAGTASAQSDPTRPPYADTSVLAPAPFSFQGGILVGADAVFDPQFGGAEQGQSVALSADGHTALVGGPYDNYPNDDAGAAWVWAQSNGTWTQQGPKLVGSGAVGVGNQGWSVALSADGNTALIGGFSDNYYVGAVWVWTRSNGVWTQQGLKLVGSGAVGTAKQGTSVALSADGDTALVGGFDDNSSVGAVWVWTRSNGAWTQQGSKLVGTGTVATSHTYQGYSVSLSADGNIALVGGPRDNFDAGAVWVWTRSGGVWTQQGPKLAGSGAVGIANQGTSVSLSADGNTALVGGDADGGWVGAVWVWTQSNGVWTQQGSKLVGSGVVGLSKQGHAVSLSGDGDTALVGGPGDNTVSNGSGFPGTGAAWVWRRSNGLWTQQGGKLVGSYFFGPADQGGSVALSADGHTALVGGPDNNNFRGAAWVFTDAAPDLVTNGTFANGLTGWQTFATPDSSYLVASVAGGVLQFSRVPPPPGTSNQATVFQETGAPLAGGAPLLLQFDGGNSSSVRKYLKVLVVNSDFSDFRACTFWLPPNAPLAPYQMKTHTTKPWTNAAIYFYAASANVNGDTGSYQVANVSLQYVPAQPADRIECIDPLTPMAPGGSQGANLLTNGDFVTGLLAPWDTFGTVTAQITGEVLQLLRPSAAPPAGVVLQPTSQPMPQGTVLTATFQLGNSSPVRKRVTAIMHDLDFSDLVACVFWVEPGQALSTYSMVGYASKAWTNATMAFYPATIGLDQWTMVDNVMYHTTPGWRVTTGSNCVEPPGGDGVTATDALRVAVSASGPVRGGGSHTAPASGPTPATTDWASEGGFLRSAAGATWEAVATTTGVSTLRMADLIDLRDAERATLRLQSWLTKGASRAAIQVRTEPGSQWVTVTEVTVSDTWQTLDVDLAAFVGNQIELQFLFDGVASLAFDLPDTWRVDDVRVEIEP